MHLPCAGASCPPDLYAETGRFCQPLFYTAGPCGVTPKPVFSVMLFFDLTSQAPFLWTDLAHFFFGHSISHWKKSIGSDRAPGVVSGGSSAAPSLLDERRALGVGSLGAEAQSSSLLLVSQRASSHAEGRSGGCSWAESALE